MKITLLSLVLCLLCSLNMAAQGSDIGSNPEDTTIHQLSKKELRRRKVAKRNIHYNILGGPSYTPDFGALIGGSALVTFRMNPSDTLQKRSVLPMAVAVMFEGGLNLMVKYRAQNEAYKSGRPSTGVNGLLFSWLHCSAANGDAKRNV